MSYQAINACRVCGSTELSEVLNLGDQALTGVFPQSPGQKVTSGPLVLIKCTGSGSCGLLQLKHSYSLDEMYGDNYGYRSGLNSSMVTHLQNKVDRILGQIDLQPETLVIDIGSNDGTTLGCYPSRQLDLLGVDPTGDKFKHLYPDGVRLIADFFSAEAVREVTSKQAEVITSFSMFYDLEDPLSFMRDIASLLSPTGVWVFEQSYMPSMLMQNSYDTICHEHLEFYALTQIKWMAERVNLKIVDLEFNAVNGGSFSVTCALNEHPSFSESPLVSKVLEEERSLGLDTLTPYQAFAERVRDSRVALRAMLSKLRKQGASIAALGASTKGNVLLQYCGFTESDISYVGEVNPDKFGCYTPGSLIPIIDETRLLELNPDYLLILPWHFRGFFDDSTALKHIKKIYPLPVLETSNTL